MGGSLEDLKESPATLKEKLIVQRIIEKENLAKEVIKNKILYWEKIFCL